MSSDGSKAIDAAWTPATGGRGREPLIRFTVLAAKILVSAAALYLAFRTVDFRLLWQRLANIDLPLFALAALAAMAQVALVAVRWRLIVNTLQATRDLSTGSALAISFAAQFVNQFLPFAAGDALRALLAARGGASGRTAVSSVLIDRGIGLIVLFLLALPPLLVSAWRADLPPLSQALFWLIVVVLAGFALTLAFGRRVVAVLTSLAVTRPLAALLDDLLRLVRDRRTFGYVVLLSFVVQGLSVAIVWTLSYVVATPAPFLALWILVPPMLIATMLPFTISGWGARESVVVAFLGGAGIPPDGALLLSVSFGAVLLVSALPGVVTWANSLRRSA